MHVSTKPQHSNPKHQKQKTFHSTPKSYATFTKKQSLNVGMRSGHSFMKNQPSPMANKNSMVFNSYLKKSYDRNRQSSLDVYNLMISHSCGKSPRCTTSCSTCFLHKPMCHSPHCVPKASQHHSSHAFKWKMCETPQ